MQVIVPSGLPDPTWAYAHRKEVVTLVHFLNTNNSCVHTHLHTQKDIHTLNNHAPHTYIHPAKRKWCFLIWSNTRNLSHSYSPSNHCSITNTHTQPQIYTFSHANWSFFSDTPIHRLFFSRLRAKKRTHADKHTKTNSQPQWSQPMALTLSLSDLQCWWKKKNKVALAKND